jgi:hypothetical protein
MARRWKTPSKYHREFNKLKDETSKMRGLPLPRSAQGLREEKSEKGEWRTIST